MSRGDTPGNGRTAPMDWPSIRSRLLQHVQVGAHGSTMISVRARDLQAVCDMVDSFTDSDDARTELEAERLRINRAIRILQGAGGTEGLIQRPPPDLRTFVDLADLALTKEEIDAQTARCPCRGSDDLCTCQNAPDAQTIQSRRERIKG